MSLLSNVSEIQFLLDRLARQHRVPGATLGILEGDRIVEFATGVANTKTGVEVTTDTMFQIGSNTKVYTATLVMQLVDQGKVDLDTPVRKYVPDFTLADPDVADAITVRHLLTHSNGIPGDHFADFGPGHDAIERYVGSLAELSPIHDPGEIFSYSNAAFVLAGHLVEKVTDKPYHEVFTENLIKPLGMTSTTIVPEEMLAHRVAAGHMVIPPNVLPMPMPWMPENTPIMMPQVVMYRCAAPAGSHTGSTPGDVLAFVRMHLNGGETATGKRVLSSDAVKLMQTKQLDVPSSTSAGPGGSIGISWVKKQWGGREVIGHGGGTVGQLSVVEIVPDRGFALVLLTNAAPSGMFLWMDLGRHLFQELCDISLPELPTAPDEPARIDLAPYEGRYENGSGFVDVKAKDGELELTTSLKPGVSIEMPGPFGGSQTMTMVAVDEERFYGRGAMGGGVSAFIGRDDQGRAKFFHSGGRASRRVS